MHFSDKQRLNYFIRPLQLLTIGFFHGNGLIFFSLFLKGKVLKCKIKVYGKNQTFRSIFAGMQLVEKMAVI